MDEIHEGILCQTKELEYNLGAFEEMIKWDHSVVKILQGHFLKYIFTNHYLLGVIYRAYE